MIPLILPLAQASNKKLANSLLKIEPNINGSKITWLFQKSIKFRANIENYDFILFRHASLITLTFKFWPLKTVVRSLSIILKLNICMMHLLMDMFKVGVAQLHKGMVGEISW